MIRDCLCLDCQKPMPNEQPTNALLQRLSHLTVLNLKHAPESALQVYAAADVAGKYRGFILVNGQVQVSSLADFDTALEAEAHMRRIIAAARAWNSEPAFPAKMAYFNAIFDVLVAMAGAPESLRDEFIHAHARTDPPCAEFRFGGLFGFGGKYLSSGNELSYYMEHATDELNKLRRQINAALARIPNVFLLNGSWSCAHCNREMLKGSSIPAWSYCPWCGSYLIKP